MYDQPSTPSVVPALRRAIRTTLQVNRLWAPKPSGFARKVAKAHLSMGIEAAKTVSELAPVAGANYRAYVAQATALRANQPIAG